MKHSLRPLSLFLVVITCCFSTYAATPVRIAAYNIKQLSGRDDRCFANVTTQGDRLARIQAVIAALDADIIGMEEISDRTALEQIFGTTDWTIVFDDEASGCTNLAVAVRKPLEVVGAVNNKLNAGPADFLFENESDFAFPEQRDVLQAQITLPDGAGTLRVLVHHGLSRSQGRADTAPRRIAASQAMLTAFQAAPFVGANFVLMGDFNDTPDDACANILETANPDAPTEIENSVGTFMVNLTEPIFAGDNVTFGRDSGDISGGQVNTVNPGIRQSNYDKRDSNSNTGDNMLDQMLVPLAMYNAAYVPGSANILRSSKTVEGGTDDRASDHLPIYADFIFGGGTVTSVFEEDFQDNTDDPTVNANDDLQEMTQVSRASTGNTADWHIFEFSSNKFARANGFGADVASDDWLITPALDLTEVQQPVLTFRSAYNFDGPALEVLASIDYSPEEFSDPDDATWTALTVTLPTSGNYTWADSGQVDLSDFVSGATYIAWRYTTAGVATGQSSVWEVDDIVVRAFTDVPLEGEGVTEGSPEGAPEGVVEGGADGEGTPEGEPVTGASLIFSEYLEGSSNNKALEIYNPTGAAVNLSNWSVRLFSNGATDPGNTLQLSTVKATLDAGDTIVIANPSADPAILAIADTTNTVTFFNGDDAIALVNGTTVVDMFGVVGEDPGTNWTDGSVSASEQTLRRKVAICTGNPTGFNPLSKLSAQWDSFPQNTFNDLGAHVVDCDTTVEGAVDGEGISEGSLEGVVEGVQEGTLEGITEGEGAGSACDTPDSLFCEDFESNLNDAVDNANDDFEEMLQYSVASTGNNANWHIYEIAGNAFARVNGFGADVASDDWLISPAFDLDGFENEVLTFDSAYNFDGPAIELFYSVKYNPAQDEDPTTATWTPLLFDLPTTGSFTFATSGAVDIASITGNAVHFAWRYTTNGVATGESRVWEVDNIVVTGTPVALEGEGVVEGECTPGDRGTPHTADIDDDFILELSEILRVVQFFNTGFVSCDGSSEDGFSAAFGETSCAPHSSDYGVNQDWAIDLTELLRAIQFYNAESYYECPDSNTEDGYCPFECPNS